MQYIPTMTDKIRKIRRWIVDGDYDVDIEVDGGIKATPETIGACAAAGASLERATLLCAFGAELVAVEVLNASVLRCISPPHASVGRVPLRVVVVLGFFGTRSEKEDDFDDETFSSRALFIVAL